MSADVGTMNGGAPVKSRTRAVAYVGLSVALIAVSAWLIVPIGPVPFTFQMLVIPLLIMVLPAKWAVAAIFAYVLLGAAGVPVFSGMRGGIGVILGPTGGFLLGYLAAVPAGALLLSTLRKKTGSSAGVFASDVAAGLLFTLVSYVGGWLWYAGVAGVSLQASFLATVAPFVLPDMAKVLLAALVARPLRAAVKL